MRLLVTLVCLLVFDVFAIPRTQTQDIEIEADTAELNNIDKTSIYSGNVIINQGAIRMHADTVTVNFDSNDQITSLVLEGAPATYHQNQAHQENYSEARAKRMEYYPAQNIVLLINQASVKQKDVEITGTRLEYNTLLRKTVVKSSQEGSENQENKRVKIKLKKKQLSD